MQAFSAITPVLPAHEQELRTTLEQLPVGGGSPFAGMASVHFARFVVLDGWRMRVRSQRSRQQPLPSLLFTSTCNSPPEEFVEELRIVLGPVNDQIWGRCVGYPGHHDPPRFRRYLLHNRVPVQLVHFAYDATVPEVRRALDLRRRHLALARSTRGTSDDHLLATFRKDVAP